MATKKTSEETTTEQAAPASSLSAEERERIANLTYEQARDELIQAVRTLETGGLSLDQSMKQWELGEALATRAQSLLGEVRAKLDAAQQAQAATSATAGTQQNLA
ncbi:exodeoxyribonuclease VII small subunit [Bifidobacterium choloepi]|uniref:Exodeoxyribonuclease 7 small subunit n=1 Tax=Bifidobacterium choloepi TaxID=2614131 RepID=A0A6I5N0I9_9BIFI|nr:exodeoxyribonuclease VII small subunit [Bifidobacterium choloepi]NEG70428.1 exodeoxyribonuclease VII small subunit [Bifidobacterium choloepi]